MGRSLSDRPLYVGFQGVAVVARALADTGAVAFDPSRHFATSQSLFAIGGIADIGCGWDWMPRWRMTPKRHRACAHG